LSPDPSGAKAVCGAPNNLAAIEDGDFSACDVGVGKGLACEGIGFGEGNLRSIEAGDFSGSLGLGERRGQGEER
jgi:hypothetical protein